MAAFGSMLHGVNIDLGFIYVSLMICAHRTRKEKTDRSLYTEHDWYLHRLSATWARRHVLLIKAGTFGSDGFYLGWILCSSDHMGKSHSSLRSMIDFWLILPLVDSCPTLLRRGNHRFRRRHRSMSLRMHCWNWSCRCCHNSHLHFPKHKLRMGDSRCYSPDRRRRQ